MLKITQAIEDKRTVTVKLSGTITSTSLIDLKEICSRLRNDKSRTILLDFSEVVFMNYEVAKKLVQIKDKRLSFINCSPYIETLFSLVDGQQDQE